MENKSAKQKAENPGIYQTSKNPGNTSRQKSAKSLRGQVSSLFSEQARSQHLSLLPTMYFPSEDWVYNDLDEFDTTPTNMRGDYTLELYAQLRPTGRMLDHFRAVLSGTKLLEINVSLMDMIPNNRFRGSHYRTQKHPSEVFIGRKESFETGMNADPRVDRICFSITSTCSFRGPRKKDDIGKEPKLKSEYLYCIFQ